VILLAGPTASGKSALALKLADDVGGEIVNADSMQVYRDLRILTARPRPADEAQVPHRLYGHVKASQAYSVGRFVAEAAQAIAAVQAAGRWPIVVGGTGLYFKALLEGLAPVPDIDPDIRNHWRGAAEQLGPQRLHDVLRARDPVMADRLRPSDSQRIVRALEVLESTGRSLAQWQAEPAVPVLAEQDCIRLVVASERGALGARIETRFDQMMADGALAGSTRDCRRCVRWGCARCWPISAGRWTLRAPSPPPKPRHAPMSKGSRLGLLAICSLGSASLRKKWNVSGRTFGHLLIAHLDQVGLRS
jgi:tRNA dimethylallyltransferase